MVFESLGLGLYQESANWARGLHSKFCFKLFNILILAKHEKKISVIFKG